MSFRLPSVWGAGAGLLLAAAALAQPPGWDTDRFLAADELVAGQAGFGLSVFQGTVVDTFLAEILGVLPTSTPSGDMILARLSGKGLETTGIIAGMSGSPVFVGGKLIGAVAFGWAFSREPIAGITPIAEMLSMRRRPEANPGFLGDARGAQSDPERWSGLWAADGAEVMELLGSLGNGRSEEAAQLRTPVSMGGFGDVARGVVSSWLETEGFLAVQGGSLGSSTDPGELVPGGGIGVILARGDAQLAGIGTVTWVDGDEVFAFGHPMLHRGGVAYPMSAASIVTVLPRASSSFKMGVAGPPLGAITRDYNPGVTGRTGVTARMIPMRLEVVAAEETRVFHFEILDAEGLTPALSGLLAVNALDALGRQSGPGTLRTRVRIVLADGREVVQDNVVAGFSPPVELAGRVARPVGLIHGNPVAPVELDRIEVTVGVDDTISASFLERIEVEPGPHAPGSDLVVRAWFRDYRGGTWSRRAAIRIPPSASPGIYQIEVCDGAASARSEQERAPGRFQTLLVDQVLQALADEAPFDALVVRLLSPEINPVIRGRELPALSASQKSLLATSLTSGRTSPAQGTVVQEIRERTGRLLIGCRGVTVTVGHEP